MKLDRYDGEVPIFSEDYEGRERTIFGSATESNNINDQFTPEFMRGWGIVGDTEFPTLQDFNALGFTLGKLISYLYQAGIPSYTANEKYYQGSIVQYNNDIYLCTATEPTSLPTDVRDWVKWQSSLGELAQIRADKNGFLLNKAGTYNALIDTDLVQATGQSQTKIMTQKAVTDALGQKQNNLTFVGTGPEVMRKGAYGVGFPNSVVKRDLDDYKSMNSGYSSEFSASADNRPFSIDGILEQSFNNPGNGYGVMRYTTVYGDIATRGVANNVLQGWTYILSSRNTRTDMNNVLHAGTGTPINTLNVSDMNQDVINNDNLTVTSGAVYRALLSKWDVQQTTGTGNIARMSEVNKKLDTSMAFGVGQSWVDVTGQRSRGTIYTNNTSKPMVVSFSGTRPPLSTTRMSFLVGGVVVGRIGDGTSTITAIIPPGVEYYATDEPINFENWVELR